MAKKAAERNGLNADLFLAQMRHESGLNPRARSRVGAVGIAQIMPATARAWGVNPHNPQQALDAAARNMAGYFKTYKAKGKDDLTAHKMALAAYNAGPEAVRKYRGIPPYRETKNYVRTIITALTKKDKQS